MSVCCLHVLTLTVAVCEDYCRSVILMLSTVWYWIKCITACCLNIYITVYWCHAIAVNAVSCLIWPSRNLVLVSSIWISIFNILPVRILVLVLILELLSLESKPDFMWYSVVYSLLHINTLLWYTLVSVSVLVLGVGITGGQCYCILGALLGIVQTLHTMNFSHWHWTSCLGGGTWLTWQSS